MPFLAVNGIELPVAPDSFEERVREVGFTGPAYSGALRKTRRAVKRDCTFETPPMLASEALAWDALLRGLGEVWSFDSHLYGSKGTGPASDTGLSVVAGGFFGNRMEIAANDPVRTASFAVGVGISWTVAVWRYGGHWTTTGDARHFLDGAFEDGTIPPWLTVSGGTVTLSGELAAASQWDDLVILPYVAPDSWIATTWAEGDAGRAFSSLPRLRVSGDAVSEAASRTCIGDVSSSRLLQGVVNGSWHTNLRKLSVTLSEV
jgi:hypothetical protein